jgi:anti-sigma factor RsiW
MPSDWPGDGWTLPAGSQETNPFPAVPPPAPPSHRKPARPRDPRWWVTAAALAVAAIAVSAAAGMISGASAPSPVPGPAVTVTVTVTATPHGRTTSP